eukprot:915476-Pyramimonas_sp.AAC.1
MVKPNPVTKKIEAAKRKKRNDWLCIVAVLVCSFGGLALVNVYLMGSLLPGFRSGDTSDPGTRKQLPYALSWKPRIFVIPGVLSHNECDELIARAQGILQESKTFMKDKNMRSSSSAFLGGAKEETD